MLTASTFCERLLAAYGPPPWWSEDPYTVMVQSVLVQNTAWTAVQKVTAALPAPLTPPQVSVMPPEALEALIRPCGFCRAKAAAIHRLTAWFAGYGWDARQAMQRDQAALRHELLAIKGVGAETADVILLYALHKPAFIIDAYTRRLLARLGYVFPGDEAIRRFFEAGLERSDLVYGRLHWLILTQCIDHCKKQPLCAACPLRGECPSAQ